MEPLAARFETELDIALNERKIQPFLKEHPILVRNTFNVWAWNHAEALPEFALGAEGKVDFLVLSADSGSWHAVFVELKSPKARFFTKNGVPGKDLNLALSQLDKRERWVRRYENVFRGALSDHLQKIDAPARCSNAAIHQKASTEILDPRVVIDFSYVAVLGRRNELTEDDRYRRTSIRERKTVATYDRLLDVAKKIDRAESELAEAQLHRV